MTGNIDEIAEAVRSLVNLLDNSVSDEADYQAWFERHDVVWNALGYVRAFPHPEIRHELGPRYPDFVAESSTTRLAEIVELKTPQLRLVRNSATRPQFYAPTNTAIAQLKEYQDILRDPLQRQALQQQVEMPIPARPNLVLIGSSAADTDPVVLHDLAADQGRNLAVLTYDDVLLRLAASGDTPLAGREAERLAVHLAVRVRTPLVQPSGVIFDIGDSRARNRASLKVDGLGRLKFDVVDARGTVHSTRTPQPLQLDGWHSVWCEAVVGGDFRLLILTVDGTTVARSDEIGEAGLRADFLRQRLVLGADLGGGQGARFDLHFYGTYAERLDVIDRSRLENYWRSRPLFGTEGGKYVQFEPGQWLFVPASGGDARQPIVGHRPTFRDEVTPT